MTALQLQGTLTAIVTPLSSDGEKIDFPALDALIEAQIAGGVSGLVPCGTTGESPTLDAEEQIAVIRRTVEVTRGRVPVFAGTGSFSTKKSIEASKAALAVGADGVMIVMPYYNKPSQDGLRAHSVAVAKSVGAPVILYNIPGRSVVDLGPEATEQIAAEAPNVIAIKDATGNVLRCQEIKRRLGDRITVLSGDDGLALPMMSVGAKGVISVTSNVLPRAVSTMVRLELEGKHAEALALHLALLEVHGSMFIEPNPAPAKAALAARKAMNDAVRLPLVAATDAARERVLAAIARFEASPAAKALA